jgi:uncharacterized protein
MVDYSQIDQSPLIGFLFYPRRDFSPCPKGAFDLAVAGAENISISCRAYVGEKNWPALLYFHGNGEVVSDYDSIAPLYLERGINLVVADYRGYGASGGSPTFTHLAQDAHKIFKTVKEEFPPKGLGKKLWIMGRSLGSISALELASHYEKEMEGMIIESGFASVTRLIKHLGLPSVGVKLEPIEQELLNRIRRITIPALIIHGEWDNLVPLAQGKEIFNTLGSKHKKLVIIKKADHNNIMFAGLDQYFSAIQKFVTP